MDAVIPKNTIGDLLSAYNLSEVARRIGVDVKTVWRWRHGMSLPSGPMLVALARFLEVDVNVIALDATIVRRGKRVSKRGIA